MIDTPKMITKPGAQASTGRISVKLPPVVLTLILKQLPYCKVFLLGGNIKEQILVAKLNSNHQLNGEDLAKLNGHPHIFGQIRQLSAKCLRKRDLLFLKGICRRCPELKRLTVDTVDDCLKHLMKCHQILARLTNLVAFVSHEDYLPPLERICRWCPELKLDLWIHGSLQEELIDYPEIIDQLTEFGVQNAIAENLSSLSDIVCSMPSASKLKLNTGDDFRELISHPELLSRLTEFVFCAPIGKEDLEWLKDLRETAPNSLSLCVKVEPALHSS